MKVFKLMLAKQKGEFCRRSQRIHEEIHAEECNRKLDGKMLSVESRSLKCLILRIITPTDLYNLLFFLDLQIFVTFFGLKNSV